MWAAALLCTIVWCRLQPAKAVKCSVYKPTGCWYTTAFPASEEPIVFPRCAFRSGLLSTQQNLDVCRIHIYPGCHDPNSTLHESVVVSDTLCIQGV